jgi:hypothetical protein
MDTIHYLEDIQEKRENLRKSLSLSIEHTLEDIEYYLPLLLGYVCAWDELDKKEDIFLSKKFTMTYSWNSVVGSSTILSGNHPYESESPHFELLMTLVVSYYMILL